MKRRHINIITHIFCNFIFFAQCNQIGNGRNFMVNIDCFNTYNIVRVGAYDSGGGATCSIAGGSDINNRVFAIGSIRSRPLFGYIRSYNVCQFIMFKIRFNLFDQFGCVGYFVTTIITIIIIIIIDNTHILLWCGVVMCILKYQFVFIFILYFISVK